MSARRSTLNADSSGKLAGVKGGSDPECHVRLELQIKRRYRLLLRLGLRCVNRCDDARMPCAMYSVCERRTGLQRCVVRIKNIFSLKLDTVSLSKCVTKEDPYLKDMDSVFAVAAVVYCCQ
jgi:hypothetical protein